MKHGRVFVGLTGNIATGKSTVARMLAEQGAHVIDADQIAHEVIAPGRPAFDAVVDAFGSRVLDADGTIDRGKLGTIVFRDPDALRRLEAIVHPAVIAEVERRIASTPEPVVVIEAIKLIEAGLHRGCDELWVVTAPRDVQIARLMATRGLSREEAALRIDAQPAQKEKVALADLIIVNDGPVEALQQQVKEAWEHLRAAFGEKRSGALWPASEPIIRAVRRDDLDDAAGVAAVLNAIIAEGRYTVLTGHWTPEAERDFLRQMGPRSELLVAEVSGSVVAFQIVEPFVGYTSAMDHVAHLGTYVLPEYRGRGIGRKLAQASFQLACDHGFEKAVVYVLADNPLGLAYYRALGFEPRGMLTRQAKIHGVYRDEIIMEMHFGG